MSRDDMLKLFRAEPERSWSIGDKYTCHVGLHKSNGMFFSPHVAKNATVEDKLAAMAKMLEDSDFDAVRQANKSLRGEFRIGLDLYSDEGCSFVLPRNLISVAQRLSMPIDIDAIFLTESEESSTPYESAVGLFGSSANCRKPFCPAATHPNTAGHFGKPRCRVGTPPLPGCIRRSALQPIIP